jgi:hypothetical protein
VSVTGTDGAFVTRVRSGPRGRDAVSVWSPPSRERASTTSGRNPSVIAGGPAGASAAVWLKINLDRLSKHITQAFIEVGTLERHAISGDQPENDRTVLGTLVNGSDVPAFARRARPSADAAFTNKAASARAKATLSRERWG